MDSQSYSAVAELWGYSAHGLVCKVPGPKSYPTCVEHSQEILDLSSATSNDSKKYDKVYRMNNTSIINLSI